MSIAEFWKSNLWSLGVVVAGYNERTRDTQEIHASMTAHTINMCQQPSKSPKRFTVYKLIGNRKNSNQWSGESFVIPGDPEGSRKLFNDHIRNLQSQPKSAKRW